MMAEEVGDVKEGGIGQGVEADRREPWGDGSDRWFPGFPVRLLAWSARRTYSCATCSVEAETR